MSCGYASFTVASKALNSYPTKRPFNFDTNIYFCQKCELISYKVIDYKHNIYNKDLFLFYFYTVQCKNLYPDLPVFFSPCN